MEQIYEQELFITPSLADARGRLSWPGAFTVCQDLAAIMCCMLRTQGLPARLVIGYADKG